MTCLHNSDFDYDVCGGFRMNVCETHQSALNRVVTEAVKIEKCSRPTMNRKTGYRANSVLRLTSSVITDGFHIHAAAGVAVSLGEINQRLKKQQATYLNCF